MRKPRHFRCLLAAHLAVLVFVALPGTATAADCAGADTLPSQATPAQYADATLCLVNAERQAAGMGPLAGHSQLSAAADGYAREIVATGVFSHRSVGGESVIDRVAAHGRLGGWELLGENLGTGTLALSTPRALVRGWMTSPSHRENVLHEGFTHLGVGVAFGSPGDAGASEAATYASAFGAASEPEPTAKKKKKRRAKRARRSRHRDGR